MASALGRKDFAGCFERQIRRCFVLISRRTIVRLVGAYGLLLAPACVILPAKEPRVSDASVAPSKRADADAKLYDGSKVGPLTDGRVIVPTNQILSPAGRQVIVGGRPTDVALSPNRKWLAVLNVNEVQLVDIESNKILSHVAIRGGSFKGIVFAPDGKRVYASTMKSGIAVMNVSEDAKLSTGEPIEVPVKR